MAPWKVLVSAPHAMPVIDRYRKELAAAGCDIIVAPVREHLEEAELIALVGDVDGIICGDDHITGQVLDAAPRLRVIAKWGTGIDSIDTDAAERRHVKVCNTPNAFSEPVADTVIGYLLLFARRLDHMTAEMQAGLWKRHQLLSLGEQTLGIVGFGNCGRAVARRAIAFGMRVIVHDVRPVRGNGNITESLVSTVPLERLLTESDFVTLHTDLHPGTFHMMNKARLAQMKRSAFLVNTSRGSVVDEAALIVALREKRIAGAALDVFENEPLPETSLLRQLPNVYLAPHSANSSPAAAERVHRSTIDNLLRVLKGSAT